SVAVSFNARTPKFTLWTRQLPLFHRVDAELRDGDGAATGRSFRAAKLTPLMWRTKSTSFRTSPRNSDRRSPERPWRRRPANGRRRCSEAHEFRRASDIHANDHPLVGARSRLAVTLAVACIKPPALVRRQRGCQGG